MRRISKLLLKFIGNETVIGWCVILDDDMMEGYTGTEANTLPVK